MNVWEASRMKRNYSGKHIREVIEDNVLPKASEEKALFTLEHLIVGSTLKRNGEDFKVDCALDINDEGILLVYIEDMKDEDISFHHFRFSDIQGIQVKNRWSFQNITLQFTDGRNYVFECMKKNTTHLPHQSEHLEEFIDVLESKQLHDMENEIHKEHVKSNRKMAFSYVATLLLFLIAGMFFSFTVFPNSFVAMVIVIILTAIVHFIFYIFSSLFLFTKKDRPFIQEFNAVMDEYKENEDTEQLLTHLLNIQHEPKNRDSKNTFYITLSTALHENNRSEEGLEYLDKVQTVNEKEIAIIKEQRKVLEGMKKSDA